MKGCRRDQLRRGRVKNSGKILTFIIVLIIVDDIAQDREHA
jgi:hypothetical protein